MKRILIFIKSLLKKMADTVKKYTDTHPVFHSMFERVIKGQKLEIKHGVHTTFHKIKSIHLTAQKPYVLLDDGNDTRVDFDTITGSQFSE